MTLYLDGMPVTALHWLGEYVQYAIVNERGCGVGGTCSKAYWLAHTVETDDAGQALLSSPDGESFADVPHGAAQPAAPAQSSAPRPDCGGAGGEMEETHHG